ncbi:hypothetical protein EGW08_014400, partial [Elysia chlorotica]
NSNNNLHHHPHQDHHHQHHQQQQQQEQLQYGNQQQQPNPPPNVQPVVATSGGGSRGSSHGSQSKGRNHHQNNQHSPTSFVLHKLSSFSRKKSESDRRKVAERELDSLNSKIDKLLSKMGDPEAESHTKLNLEEECVVCLAAPACMQTFPCGHKVVCRKCLIKTIQVAVSQRCLPLRCVICRNRILRLQHTTAASVASSGLDQPSQSSHQHAVHKHQQHHQHQQQHQHQYQHNGGLCNMRSPASPIPPYSPTASIGLGCATASSLTMTPIVIQSLAESTQDLRCTTGGAILHGVGQEYPGELSSMPPRPFSSLSHTSASSIARAAGCATERSEFSRQSMSIPEIGPGGELFKRASPSSSPSGTTNMEAFVFSHNDALNLHTARPAPNCTDQDCHHCGKSHYTSSIPISSCCSKTRKVRPCVAGKRDASMKVSCSPNNAPDGSKLGSKPSGKAVFSTKQAGVSTSTAVGFFPGQTIKVHPENMVQTNGFMMSPQPPASDPSLVSNHSSPAPSRFSKSNISASKFIAKFLPKSSRRRYSWLRHE